MPDDQRIVRVTIIADYHVWRDVPEMTNEFIRDYVAECLPGVVPNDGGDEGAWIGNCNVRVRNARTRLREVRDA